ncbi:MAG: hypothetical protein QOD56_2477, partial [Gammaproteobacteria bacterium]|nr:hypothetical protein [Gammaproteobacteria bacterium]
GALMDIVPGWHPVVVHFPLALIVTAALALSLARVLRGESAGTLAVVGTWNLCLGAVTVFVALSTGLAAVIGLHVDSAARQAISVHVKSAMVTTLLVTLIAVWRGAGTAANSRPSWFFVLMLWIATSALIVTGYRGGQNVYRHGIGVALHAATAGHETSARVVPGGRAHP